MNHPGEMFDLGGKVAIVTGASRGLGKAIALGLARAGKTVFIAALVRLQSSLLLLLPVLILMRRWENPLGLMDRDRKGTYQMILGSVVGPFLGISFSLLAVKHTSVGVAATLMATVPIMMLPIVRVLYKEELNWRAVAGAVVAVGGVGLLFAR